MKLNINFRNVPGSADIIGQIDHRLSFFLSRMNHEIESIDVTLSDINGPKAGVDKQCKVIIKPVGLKKLVITEKRDSFGQAVDTAISRASQSLARKLKRKHLFKRHASIKKIRDLTLVPEIAPNNPAMSAPQ